MTDSPIPMEIAFIAACAVLVWTGFFRLSVTNLETRFWIRFSVWALTVAALVGLTAVLVWNYEPAWPAVVLAIAAAAAQAFSSRLWRDGTPDVYSIHSTRHQ